MTTITDVKLYAKRLKEFLEQRDKTITHSTCLLIVSKMFGFKDWNTLSAILKQQGIENNNSTSLESKNQINTPNDEPDYLIDPRIMDGVMYNFFGMDDSPLKLKYYKDDSGKISGVTLNLNNENLIKKLNRDEYIINGKLVDGSTLVDQTRDEKNWMFLLGMQLGTKIREISYSKHKSNRLKPRPQGLTQTNLVKATYENRNSKYTKIAVEITYTNGEKISNLLNIEQYISKLPPTHNPLVYAQSLQEILSNDFTLSCSSSHIDIFYIGTKVATITAGKLSP